MRPRQAPRDGAAIGRWSRNRGRRNATPRSACPATVSPLTRKRLHRQAWQTARLPPDRVAVETCRPWGPSLGGDRIAGEHPYTPHPRTPVRGNRLGPASNLYSLVMRLVAAGLSFRTAPLAVREAAAIPAARAGTTLRYLVGHAGLHGAAVLSTCNRTDFYVVCPDHLSAEVTPRLARYLDPGGAREVERHMVTLEDREAAMHMFRVASGLESMVIGEAQVLGQFKAAHRVATDAGTVDARLDYVMRRAISTAKRGRTNTSLGRGAASLSEIASESARSACGNLDGIGVLLVGAGKMSRLAAQRLREQGARIMTTSRGDSSRRLARAVGAEPVDLAALGDVAEEVDVIIASTDSATTVLDAAAISTLQHRRSQRPLCIVDMAVPRDIHAAAAAVPGVH